MSLTSLILSFFIYPELKDKLNFIQQTPTEIVVGSRHHAECLPDMKSSFSAIISSAELS